MMANNGGNTDNNNTAGNEQKNLQNGLRASDECSKGETIFSQT